MKNFFTLLISPASPLSVKRFYWSPPLGKISKIWYYFYVVSYRCFKRYQQSTPLLTIIHYTTLVIRTCSDGGGCKQKNLLNIKMYLNSFILFLMIYNLLSSTCTVRLPPPLSIYIKRVRFTVAFFHFIIYYRFPVKITSEHPI